MTGEAFDFFKGVVAQFWILFTSWHVPGTNLTVGGWIVFMLSAGVLFRFLGKLGFGNASLTDIKSLGRNKSKDSD